MVARILELRQGPDRRQQQRGGRRDGDREGQGPLVLVVGEPKTVGNAIDAVLAKLRFAVTTTDSADGAIGVVNGVHPDIVVASPPEAQRIKAAAPDVKVIEMTDAMRDDHDALVEGIREAIRQPRK